MAGSRTGELHQALIRDHFRRPRNRGTLGGDAISGKAHNPFCGDTVRIWARVEDGAFDEVAFDGRGCSISLAAASMLTVAVHGVSTASLAELRQAFVDGLSPEGAPLPKSLGDLRALAGVGRFPSRVRCAILPFDALEAALRSAPTTLARPTASPTPDRQEIAR